MSREKRISWNGMMKLALEAWAAERGVTVDDLMSVMTRMDAAADGEPVFVIQCNTDRARIEPEAFEPGGA